MLNCKGVMVTEYARLDPPLPKGCTLLKIEDCYAIYKDKDGILNKSKLIPSEEAIDIKCY